MKEFTCHFNFERSKKDHLDSRGVMDLFLKTAYAHWEVSEDLEEDYYGWMIYRWQVEFKCPPNCQDQIEVTTLVNEVNKLFAYRHFILKQEGEVLARAGSLWIQTDLRRREAISIPEKDHFKDPQTEKTIPNRQLRRAKKKKLQGPGLALGIDPADIDENDHVNNLVYLSFMERALEEEKPGFKEAYRLRDLDITYSHEIRHEDQVLVVMGQEEEGVFYFTIWDQKQENIHAYMVGKFVKDLDG
ncbi:MAG: thioesterase [Tissierellia bacterium]|nr:thioesterase [Tissierellia bacterium]